MPKITCLFVAFVFLSLAVLAPPAHALSGLRVKCDVDGATVWLDGQPKGSCPAKLTPKAGHHTLLIEKPIDGDTLYQYQTEVNLIESEITTVNASLEKVYTEEGYYKLGNDDAYLQSFPNGKYVTAIQDKRRRNAAALAQRLKGLRAEATKLLVPVKGGCFDMGDTFGDGGAGEKPVHRVCLDDFRMDKHEVTQSAFTAAMGNNPSYHKDCPDCPVEQVTWDEAKAYCENVGKRLPTEAEWEYSAREGGKNVKYGTGKNELSKSDANYSSEGTKPVGSYAPNALGLYDMAGNVFEWAADWYGAYSSGEQKNPKGSSSGSNRVLRGGSWAFDPRYLRVSDRLHDDPTSRGSDVGFRCSQY